MAKSRSSKTSLEKKARASRAAPRAAHQRDEADEATKPAVEAPAPTSRSAPFDVWQRFERKDRPVARLRGQAALYFRLQKREMLAPVLAAFQSWLAFKGADHYEWFRRYDRVDCERVDSKTIGRLKLYLEGLRRDSRGVQLMHMEPPEEDSTLVLEQARASQLNARISERGDYAFTSNASFLRMIVPSSDLAEQSSRVRDLVLAACETFPVQSGIVGYVLAEGLELRGPRSKAAVHAVTEALLRFPTVDVQDDFAALLAPADRARYVGWLTVLGETAVEKLGGETKVKRQLGQLVELHRTRHALVLQAEPEPRLHEAPADALEAYRRVYHVIAPLLEPVVKLVPEETRLMMTRLA